MNTRRPFDENEATEVAPLGPKRKIGLQQPTSNSSLLNNQIKTDFNDQADKLFNKSQDYKSQIWDLSIKYKSFVQNQTLIDNKGPIAINFEKEVIDKLSQLALEMNEDITQQEGIGSTALCVLLLKCMLLQRDIINNISFKLDKLTKTT